MSVPRAFERHDQNPRYFQVQTRLSTRQEQEFVRYMRKNGLNRAQAARVLISRWLEVAHVA